MHDVSLQKIEEEITMIVPTSGRLVLQKIKCEENTDNLPNQDRYLVVKMYAGLYGSSMNIHPFEGDVVYIDKYKGVEITKDGETYLVIEDQDIIAYESMSADT